MTLEALEAMDAAARDALLLPPDAPLSRRGAARRRRDDRAGARRGAHRQSRRRASPGRYRCYGPQGDSSGLIEASGGALRSLRLARTDTLSFSD